MRQEHHLIHFYRPFFYSSSTGNRRARMPWFALWGFSCAPVSWLFALPPWTPPADDTDFVRRLRALLRKEVLVIVVSVRSSSVRSAPLRFISATNINRRVRRDVKFTFLEDLPYCLGGLAGEHR